MCRLLAYLGQPLALDELLFKPRNSLVNQSLHAREMYDPNPTNGDGFGIGWYNLEISPEPAIFTSVLPAWNDQNLRYITPKIYSNCFFAHVRAASAGGVSQFNCHPFQYKRFLFMHNGGIGGFMTMKRHLRHLLPDDIYEWVKGQTDSEHLSALFIHELCKSKSHHDIENLAKVFVRTLRELNSLREKYNIVEPDYINFVLTDGIHMLAVRYTSDPKREASTLYYANSDRIYVEHGKCHLPLATGPESAVLVVSEKLDSHQGEWHEIPVNHMLLVDDDRSISVKPIVIE